MGGSRYSAHLAADDNRETWLSYRRVWGSPTEAHTARQALKPGVGTKGIETAPQKDAGVKPFLIRSFEPGHRFIAIAGMHPRLSDTFRLTGLDQLFLVETSCERAVDVLAQTTP